MNKWLFIPYSTNNKDIRIYLLLDNIHFGRVGNIEIILNATYEKLLTKQKIRGYMTWVQLIIITERLKT